jgi:hypothetical protein
VTASEFLAGLLACLALAGCQDPYSDSRPRDSDYGQPVERRRAEAARGDEPAPSAPAADSAPAYREAAARRTARAALETFCSQWANWSWRTIDRQQQRLAGLATATLAEQLAAQARQGRLDGALRRDRLGVRGQVVAVELEPAASPGRAVCVTREQEVQDGRGELGGHHRVYLATLDQTALGWGVSRWEPQP